MAGNRQPFTRETYAKLLEAFRERPGAIAFASRAALCDRRTAARTWDGAPRKQEPWAIPIRQVLADEHTAAMARTREAELARRDRERAEQESTATKAREEHTEQLAAERQLLKLARNDVLAALAIAAEMAPSMRTLAAVVAHAAKRGEDGSLPDITPSQAMTLLSRHATIMQKAVGAADTVLALSRLDRGEATSIVGLQAVQGPELTYEEALAELEAATIVLHQEAAHSGSKARRLGNGSSPGGRPERAGERNLTRRVIESPVEE